MQAIYEPAGAAREYSPLACNLYKGCSHGCRYCYAPACLRMKPDEFWAGGSPRPGVLAQLAKDAPKHRSGKPVLFCFTSDPYQPHEDGTTRQAIRVLKDAGVSFNVLTKGGRRACRDIDLYRRGDAFGTTILFTRDEDRRQWEPNAAPVADRIETIRRFHEAGVRTWVSIEPVIEPAQAVAVVTNLAPIVDEFRVGKLNHHAVAASVDWTTFARDVIGALDASGCDYMVKDALRPFLPHGAPTSRYAQATASDEAVETDGQFTF